MTEYWPSVRKEFLKNRLKYNRKNCKKTNNILYIHIFFCFNYLYLKQQQQNNPNEVISTKIVFVMTHIFYQYISSSEIIFLLRRFLNLLCDARLLISMRSALKKLFLKNYIFSHRNFLSINYDKMAVAYLKKNHQELFTEKVKY